VHFLPAIVSLAVASPRVNATDYGKLDLVAFAEGDAYVRLRDSLLEEMTEPWDVAAATAVSWQTGLAAFILNQRREAPDVCARWDKRSYSPKRGGFWYSLHGAPAECALAFLWEEFWKGENEGVRNAAYHDLHNRFGSRFPGLGEPSLWRAIWDNLPDERSRHIAILSLASADVEEPDPVIRDVVGNSSYSVVLRSACIAGLGYHPTDVVADIIIEAWQDLRSHSGALAVLGRSTSPRAREFMHAFILDEKQDEFLRGEALGAFTMRADEQDGDVFLRIIREPASKRLKRRAMQALQNAAPVVARPAIHWIFENETDAEMLGAAVLALALSYHRADACGTPEAQQDAALVREIGQREGASDGLKRSCDRSSRVIEGYRGPMIGDKWPWERPPGGGD
jgi:hypothetical protein